MPVGPTSEWRGSADPNESGVGLARTMVAFQSAYLRMGKVAAIEAAPRSEGIFVDTAKSFRGAWPQRRPDYARCE